MTEEEIEQQIDEKLTAEKAHFLVKTIACALWGEDADKDWNADTIDEIAHALDAHGIGPSHK